MAFRGYRVLAVLAAMIALYLPQAVNAVPVAAARAQASGPSAGRVLFQWKFPARGHTGSWTFQKGTMAFDGESPGYAFPSIVLKGATNFAVEATMRSPGSGGSTANLTGFGVVVGHSPSNPHTSISGGSFFSTQSEDNNPQLYWNSDTVGGAAFTPGTAWHTYRLEVHENLYTLFIDGHQVVQYPIDDHPFPTRAGVFSLYDRVQVKTFKILGLTSNGSTSSPAPRLKRLNLTLPDLPTSDYFQPLLQHYTTNVEAAREQNTSVAALEAQGRITSYVVSWFPWGLDFFDLLSSVTLFRTSANAQASSVARLEAFKQVFSGSTNFRLLPDEHIGDTNRGLRLDIVSGDQTLDVFALLFTRGNYSVLLRAVFYGGQMSESDEIAKIVSLAKVIDSRVSSP